MLRSVIAFPCWVLLVCCLAVPDEVAGQATQPDLPPAGAAVGPAPTEDEEADHEALRQLRQVYERAVNEDQIDLLAPHLHPDFFGVMITNAHVRNIEEMRAYWQGLRALMGAGGRYTTTLHPERSVIIGDLALARGTTDDLVVTGEGQEYRFSTSWTVVCQREGGQWKVLRAQATMNPVENEFVQTFLGRAVRQGGLAGGVVGLALGGLGAFLVGRRSRVRRA